MCYVKNAGGQAMVGSVIPPNTHDGAVHAQAAADLAQIFDPFCVEEYFIPSSKACPSATAFLHQLLQTTCRVIRKELGLYTSTKAS